MSDLSPREQPGWPSTDLSSRGQPDSWPSTDLFGPWWLRDRSLACLALPAFGLQLLLVKRPEWRALPVVVIDEDRPQGLILEANTLARQQGIHPGQRYAHALGLSQHLRAAVVSPGTMSAGIAHIVSILRMFSPHIEPADTPGAFWLDTRGLESLHGSLTAWATAVTTPIESQGFTSYCAVGFTRFGTHAIAKWLGATSGPSIQILSTPEDEQKLAGKVPLDDLSLSPSLRERLDRLAIHTLGELAALPRAGLLRRFGPDVLDLLNLFHGERDTPLTPLPESPRLLTQIHLDEVERDATRLSTHVERMLLELTTRSRGGLVTELVLILGREGQRVRDTVLEHHRLRPAAPTRDQALLLDLVGLRLAALAKPSSARTGFVLVALELFEIDAVPVQTVFEHKDDDDTAASRALARVIAELGEGRVVLLTPREGHLPRARQTLVPLRPEALHPPALPTPQATDPPLVRRLHRAPEPGAAPDPRSPTFSGPYLVSGGWWGALRDTPSSSEVSREYAYDEAPHGEIVWLYYDRRRRAWLEEGVVG